MKSEEPIVVDLVSSSDEEKEEEKKRKLCPTLSRRNQSFWTTLAVMVLRDAQGKDVARLTDGRMLNDSLIDFYLKYLSDKFREIIPTVTSRVLFSAHIFTRN